MYSFVRSYFSQIVISAAHPARFIGSAFRAAILQKIGAATLGIDVHIGVCVCARALDYRDLFRRFHKAVVGRAGAFMAEGKVSETVDGSN